MERIGYSLVYFFSRNIVAQSASLRMALYDFPADLVLADSLYWGTLPMLVGPRNKRPSIAQVGVSIRIGSGKNISMRPGETPEQRDAEMRLRESGAGIDLRTNRATPEAIQLAVDEIYGQPRYRERVEQLSLEFASHDAKAELLSLIEECVVATVDA